MFVQGLGALVLCLLLHSFYGDIKEDVKKKKWSKWEKHIAKFSWGSRKKTNYVT